MEKDQPAILIGSTYPLSLIRRGVSISPQSTETLRQEILTRPICSFWGHKNTLSAAEHLLGVDVRPKTDRPAIILNGENLPCLDGECFQECWVLSPDYVNGFRPAIAEEVATDKIIGWQILKITWE